MSAHDNVHHTPGRLRFDGTVNIPTLVVLLTLMLTGASGWNNLTNRVTKIEEAQAAGYVRGQGRDTKIDTLNAEVRSLQLAQTRSDERFNAILDNLREIRTQLEERQ